MDRAEDADSPPPHGPRGAWIVPASLVVGVGAATLLGLVGGPWWLLDLLAHFRMPYAVLLAMALVAFAAGRRWVWAGASGALLAVNLFLLAPLYLAAPARPAEGAKPLRLLTFNVRRINPTPDAAIEYLRESQADLSLLWEIDQSWFERLERAGIARAGVALARPREDNFGFALLSRIPLQEASPLVFERYGIGALKAQLAWEGRTIVLLGVHLYPPVSAQVAAGRDAQLAQLAGIAATQPSPVILAGDLNATPFSHAFGKLLRATGLINSQRGFGLQPTWRAGCGPLKIPIDHVLHGPELTTLSRTVGPSLGSDHHPVLVELAWAAR